MSASRRLRRSLAVATLALVPATPAVAADDIAVSTAELTRTYRGADGSALYTKNGGSGGGASRSMMYPGDVQVFITRNSTGNPAEPSSTDMLRAAWEAALV